VQQAQQNSDELIQFRGRGVAWSRYSLPLWIVIHPDLEPWRHIIKQEANAWNARLGFPIFRLGSELPAEHNQGSVVPFRPIWDQNPHTRLYFGAQSNILASPVYLPHLRHLDPAIHSRVVAHELGHVLGLTHDADDPISLMYPQALPLDWAVQSDDVQALRDKYGRPRQQEKSSRP